MKFFKEFSWKFIFSRLNIYLFLFRLSREKLKNKIKEEKRKFSFFYKLQFSPKCFQFHFNVNWNWFKFFKRQQPCQWRDFKDIFMSMSLIQFSFDMKKKSFLKLVHFQSFSVCWDHNYLCSSSFLQSFCYHSFFWSGFFMRNDRNENFKNDVKDTNTSIIFVFLFSLHVFADFLLLFFIIIII